MPRHSMTASAGVGLPLQSSAQDDAVGRAASPAAMAIKSMVGGPHPAVQSRLCKFSSVG